MYWKLNSANKSQWTNNKRLCLAGQYLYFRWRLLCSLTAYCKIKFENVTIDRMMQTRQQILSGLLRQFNLETLKYKFPCNFACTDLWFSTGHQQYKWMWTVDIYVTLLLPLSCLLWHAWLLDLSPQKANNRDCNGPIISSYPHHNWICCQLGYLIDSIQGLENIVISVDKLQSLSLQQILTGMNTFYWAYTFDSMLLFRSICKEGH